MMVEKFTTPTGFKPATNCSRVQYSTHVLNLHCHHSPSPRVQIHVMGMLQFMSDINQPSLPTPFFFNSVLGSIPVFMALSTVFHFINSPANCPFSDSVLPVLSLPYWSFQLYISLFKTPSDLIYSLVVDWAQHTN